MVRRPQKEAIGGSKPPENAAGHEVEPARAKTHHLNCGH
jgi:hypothetical protein